MSTGAKSLSANPANPANGAAGSIPTDAVALNLATASFDDWWKVGTDLFTQRRAIDWMCADWLAQGVEKFGEQACFEFATEKLALDRKEMRETAKVAAAFPPALRAPDVSFKVHSYIAQLPEERRLSTLKRASDEHWGARDVKRVVIEHRHQTAMFVDEDAEARFGALILRAWNNAPKEAREYAWPLIQKAVRDGFTVADEDEAIDA